MLLHSSPIASQAEPGLCILFFISNVQLGDIMSSVKKKERLSIQFCSSPLTPFFKRERERNLCWNYKCIFFTNHESILNSHLHNAICIWEINSLGLECTKGQDLTIASFCSSVQTLHSSEEHGRGKAPYTLCVRERFWTAFILVWLIPSKPLVGIACMRITVNRIYRVAQSIIAQSWQSDEMQY